jgi:hypothetical protein
VRGLIDALHHGRFEFVVEADIKGFFDHIQHDWMLRMLGQRISDGAMVGLIGKWLKAGILEPDGRVLKPESGTPQGGIVSPVLANVYLHYALDCGLSAGCAKPIGARAGCSVMRTTSWRALIIDTRPLSSRRPWGSG